MITLIFLVITSSDKIGYVVKEAEWVFMFARLLEPRSYVPPAMMLGYKMATN